MLSKSLRATLASIVATCLSFAFSQREASAGYGNISSTITVYSQPPSPSGGLFHSSRWDPDGSDYDQYVWDNFTLPSSYTITEIQWRGGFDPAYFGAGGPVIDFRVAIYPSIPAGTEPNIVNPPLVEYQTGGNAGQTPAGVFGDVMMYDYTFTLPTPFQAVAGTKYWVLIEAWQHGIPDWGITRGTGGNGAYFRKIYCNTSFCAPSMVLPTHHLPLQVYSLMFPLPIGRQPGSNSLLLKASPVLVVVATTVRIVL